MPHTLLFDLDGTLVDSAPDITFALNAVLAERGLGPVPLQATRDMVGSGAFVLLSRAMAYVGAPVDDAELPGLYERFGHHYRPICARETRPYPGVVETLERLARRHPLAVATNKPQAPADQILAALGMDHLFQMVVGGDAVPHRKPHPGHLQVILERLGRPAIHVGDSETDVEAARAAGLPVIGVTWGYNLGRPLHADRLVNRFEEVEAAVADLEKRGSITADAAP